MALRKLTGCKHQDKNLVVENRSADDSDVGGQNSWSWTILKCKVCSRESNTELTNKDRQGHDFGKCYLEVTGRDWITEDDKNQLSVLRENPRLFWSFVPQNAKYLIDKVPFQKNIQDKIDGMNEKRNLLLRELKKIDVKINELFEEAGRERPYVGRQYK